MSHAGTFHLLRVTLQRQAWKPQSLSGIWSFLLYYNKTGRCLMPICSPLRACHAQGEAMQGQSCGRHWNQET